VTAADIDNSDRGFVPPYAPQLTGKEGFIRATWKFMRNPLEGFGPLAWKQPIVSVPTFGFKTHTVCDPEGMMQVLATESHKFTKSPVDARILGPATKEGLLSVHGAQWKRQRRGVAPMFRPRHMAELAATITDVIHDFTHILDRRREIDLNLTMADLTFEVLSRTLLGDPQGVDGRRLRRATRKAVTAAGTLRPDDLLPLPGWVPRPVPPGGMVALRTLKRSADILLGRRDEDAPGDDLVGLLISARDPQTGEPLTQRERRDNLIGFFIAGHETTALTLTWAIYLLAMCPDVAGRVRREVLNVAGRGDVEFDHLNDLIFTQAVLDETMRLYPPAPMINRKCREATVLLERNIEPDDHIILNYYIMHRAPRLWDRPGVFDPDRFVHMPELKARGSAFMPFGAGPRICIGAAFATMEAKMVLATLVRDYDIFVPPNCYPRPVMTVTLRPQGKIPTQLKKV